MMITVFSRISAAPIKRRIYDKKNVNKRLGPDIIKIKRR